mgnify:CR=1 FL=1
MRSSSAAASAPIGSDPGRRIATCQVWPATPAAAASLIDAREKAFWMAKANGADDVVDIVVPRAQIPAFMEKVAALAGEYEAWVAGCGHAGDGNVHVNIPVLSNDRAMLDHLACVARALRPGGVLDRLQSGVVLALIDFPAAGLLLKRLGCVKLLLGDLVHCRLQLDDSPARPERCECFCRTTGGDLEISDGARRLADSFVHPLPCIRQIGDRPHKGTDARDAADDPVDALEDIAHRLGGALEGLADVVASRLRLSFGICQPSTNAVRIRVNRDVKTANFVAAGATSP